MEATGVYWKPVWHVLEDDFELILVNARHVKQVPGRKTDVQDAQWLCRLAEAGLLRASFVPPKPIRELRSLTRYRKAQISERQREANRLHKAIEDTWTSSSTASITDILGVSGRAMLDALVAGTTDPGCSPSWRRGGCARRSRHCARRLRGASTAHHSLLIGAILAHLHFLDEQIELLSEAIEAKLGPLGEAAVELLCTIPGIKQRTAENVIAEIGTDMSQFPSAGHLASWAGQCPGNHESAGKRRSGRTRKGSKWLNLALKEAAAAAINTNGSYLQALYRRKKAQGGHSKALGAVKHSILCAIWHMLQTGELYADLGPDHLARRNPERQARRLVAQLERLGHTVTLQDGAA